MIITLITAEAGECYGRRCRGLPAAKCGGQELHEQDHFWLIQTQSISFPLRIEEYDAEGSSSSMHGPKCEPIPRLVIMDTCVFLICGGTEH